MMCPPRSLRNANIPSSNGRDQAAPAGPYLLSAAARQRVRAAVPADPGAGLLERRRGYYAWKIPLTIGLLATGWAAFALVGDSWWQLAVAALLAVMFAQIGSLGHDAGRRQVFGTRRASYLAGILLGNAGIGLSYGTATSPAAREPAARDAG
jgi:fatty acid desaturase